MNRAASTLLLLLLAACPSRRAADRESLLPPGFEVQLDSVVYQRLGADGQQVEAHTAQVLLSPSSGEARFERIELQTRTDPATGGAPRVVAGSGRADLYRSKLNLADGVRVEDGQGRVLDAPSAAYDPDARQLAGPGPATLSGSNFVLRAENGFVIDRDAAAVDLLGPVSGYAERVEPAPAPAATP